jgi:hypothetical protein
MYAPTSGARPGQTQETSMVDSDKIAGAAAGIAEQASELADQVKEKVGDAIGKAVPAAAELATKAADAAAQGLDVAAGTLKGLTGGKGAAQIDAVSSTIKNALPTSD